MAKPMTKHEQHKPPSAPGDGEPREAGAAAQWEFEAMRRLQALSVHLAEPGRADDLHRQILDAAIDLLAADSGTFQILTNERGKGDEFHLVAHRGLDDEAAALWEWVEPSTPCCCGAALREKRRSEIEDAEKSTPLDDNEHVRTMKRLGARAMQTTPLVSRSGRILGAFSTHWRAPHALNDLERRLLDVLARQAADLLERQRAEQALSESEERYRTLFHSMDEAYAVVEVIRDASGRWSDFRFINVNPAFSKHTGIKDPVGRTCNELLGTPNPRWAEVYGEVAETGEPVRLQESEATLGRTFDLYIFRLGGPGSRCVAVLFTDITERMRTEAALRDSEATLRLLFDDLPALISLHEGREHRFIYANRALKEAFAGRPLVGQPLVAAVPGTEGHDLAAVCDQVFQTGEPVELCQFPLVCDRSGRTEERVFHLLVQPRSSPDGSTEGVMTFAHDITDQQKLERALREAGRRKDDFLAMLAHELRNPLAPIRSGLDLLSMDDQDCDRRTVNLMQGQVEHLVRLVDDLLDVSRIMRGKITLRRQTENLGELVRRARESTAGSLRSRNQHLRVSLPEEPVWIHADPIRIVQILDNLLANASKYTGDGGRIDLTVRCDDGHATVSVRDNGIGIEPDLLPHVFELFTQSSQTLDRSAGGLGIGLALVRQLAELHGASVSAESPGPGQGSTFILRLPVTEPPERRDELPPRPRPARRCRILIVDDNAPAAEVFAALLVRLGGHQVEVAHDGPAGFETARRFRPHIVFLDIGLPGMDGLEVAKLIRRMPELQDTLLVALTGYGQAEDRRKSREAGFDEHLVKPPSLEQIQKVLGDPRLPRDGGATVESRPAPPERGELPAPARRCGANGEDPPDLRRIRHDLRNTTHTLKMACQLLGGAKAGDPLVERVVHALESEIGSLDRWTGSPP